MDTFCSPLRVDPIHMVAYAYLLALLRMHSFTGEAYLLMTWATHVDRQGWRNAEHSTWLERPIHTRVLHRLSPRFRHRGTARIRIGSIEQMCKFWNSDGGIYTSIL